MSHQNNFAMKANLRVCALRANMHRNLCCASYATGNTYNRQSVRTYTLLNHPNQSVTRVAQPGYRHPLAQRDPSQRNIALPDNVHAKCGSADALPA